MVMQFAYRPPRYAADSGARGPAFALTGAIHDQAFSCRGTLLCSVLLPSRIMVPSSTSLQACCTTASRGAHSCRPSRTIAVNNSRRAL